MNNITKDYRILYFLVIGISLINSPLILDKDNIAYAFFGFFLSDGGGIMENEKTYSSSPMSLPFPAKTTTHTSTFTQSHGSLQSSECYYQFIDIMNLCNIGGLLENNITHSNLFGQ